MRSGTGLALEDDSAALERYGLTDSTGIDLLVSLGEVLLLIDVNLPLLITSANARLRLHTRCDWFLLRSRLKHEKFLQRYREFARIFRRLDATVNIQISTQSLWLSSIYVYKLHLLSDLLISTWSSTCYVTVSNETCPSTWLRTWEHDCFSVHSLYSIKYLFIFSSIQVLGTCTCTREARWKIEKWSRRLSLF